MKFKITLLISFLCRALLVSLLLELMMILSQRLLKSLKIIPTKYPQEKVHLHLDKPYYAIGDDIWFKAYIVDAKSAVPSTLSEITIRGIDQ